MDQDTATSRRLCKPSFFVFSGLSVLTLDLSLFKILKHLFSLQKGAFDPIAMVDMSYIKKVADIEYRIK